MSRRRIVRRAGVCAVTFVLVSALARLIISTLWSWSVASYRQDEALRQALAESGRAGEEEALKDELWRQWNEAEKDSSGAREHSEIFERFEAQIRGVWGVSFLFGLVAAGLVWVPTAPKHATRHHWHHHHRRSHSRRRSTSH